MTDAPAPSRAVSDDTSDDVVLPFRTERSGVIGRLARLGPVVDTILRRHDYPAPVSEALGQAIALTAMLGLALKVEGRLSLQTRTDGPLDFLVVDYESPGRVRGYASFDKARIQALSRPDGTIDQGTLLGSGHLALTMEAGGAADRHQGIVPLAGENLTEAALAYFRQSEQLPSFIRLTVARHYGTAEAGSPRVWHWRAGGLMIQHLTREPGDAHRDDPDDQDDDLLVGETDDHWQLARLLAETVEDHELLDPMLAPERLLFRLFHEVGVRAYRSRSVQSYCRCSRERVETFLRRFGAAELVDMREPDGGLTVTCEFCTAKYHFAPGEIG
jgi:molecular chaperone Hsp33